jgi:hypothetical protein
MISMIAPSTKIRKPAADWISLGRVFTPSREVDQQKGGF